MLPGRLFSHLATVGLIVVIVLMTSFAMWAALTSQSIAQQTRTAVSLDDYYLQARYWLSEENRLQTLYRLQPTPKVASAYSLAGATLISTLKRSQQSATTTNDRATITTILGLHAQYQAVVQQEFAAVIALDRQRVSVTGDQSETAVTALEQQMNMLAQHVHQEALNRLADLEHTQQIIVITTPLIFFPGVCFIVVFTLVLRTYRHKEQAEMYATLSRQMQEDAMQAELIRLQQSALTDNLTQLGNHRAFQEAHHRELLQAQRYEETLSLALLDVDEFKQYNDQYGHAYGDHILKTLATVLRQEDQAFRLGGDEFAILFRHTAMAQAAGILENLRTEIQQQLSGVTISIGLTTLQMDSTNAAILQEQADAALYEAKRRGRNCLVTFPEIQEQVALLTSAQAQALRNLLEERHLQIAFQPIWDLRQDAFLGFEALMRPDSKYGFSGPQEAFDIAERLGHAHDLDTICREAILARATELPPHQLIFINLSPQTLDHYMLAGNTLMEAILAAGLTPEQVVLEITERSIARPEVVVPEAARLRNLGFKLALDDAGSGNAGLEMLSQMAVDYVKIDRSVIAKAPVDNTARAVLAGILAIARETKSYVIAEGIEDQKTLEFIRCIGLPESAEVHGVQGYLLGRPSISIPTIEDISTRLQAA